MMERIGSYVNGNYIVTMYDNGTKVRSIKDGDEPLPEFPESIDLKITNRCDNNCPMCHERSTPEGDHGCLNTPFLSTLQPFTEVAIGGGNPLEHPDLLHFLVRMKNQKVITNMTVHWKHFEKNRDMLKQMIEDGLIHGIGVSVNKVIPCGIVDSFADFPNLVVHTIAGMASEEVYRQLEDRGMNLLILGYKSAGNGRKYFHLAAEEIVERTAWLRANVFDMRDHFKAIAFDHAALRQMDIRQLVSDDEWKNLYMGGDGQFTMYVDLVDQKFATSSTCPIRYDVMPDIRDMFSIIREENEYA